LTKKALDLTDAASTLVLQIEGARATLRLNRPKHMDRLQPADLQALMDLFDRIKADKAIRVLVLIGTGPLVRVTILVR
jgi:enoyl-CoA hydratase